MARFAYYQRLSPRGRAIYRASDALERLALPEGAPLEGALGLIRGALEAGDRARVGAGCEALVAELARRFRVPPLEVAVLAKRPRRRGSELHGLYEAGAAGRPARISVWMRTARRRQVVAFRTFLRTLLHEFCHHLDYTLLRLPESFHTEGFYKRESSLMRQVLGEPEAATPGL